MRPTGHWNIHGLGFSPYNFFLTSLPLSECPFLYDIMGSSLKILFSNGCCFIKCRFRRRISLGFRTACCNSILALFRLCDFPVLSFSGSYFVFGPFAPY